HFTKGVLESLAQRHIKTDFITLHVGAGTFRPVKAEQMEGHAMHAEWIQVGVNQLDNIIAHLDKTIVATGTTTLRTLESLYWLGNQILNGQEPDLNGIAVTQWVPYEAYPQHDSIEALKTL